MTTTIYAVNLPRRVTSNELRRIFSTYGEIVYIRIRGPEERPYAFVAFQREK